MINLTKLESLYEFADERDILVLDRHFSDTKRGACFCTDISNNILLDKARIANEAEEVFILSGELGHIEEGALYRIHANVNAPFAAALRRSCDYRAKVWRILHLLPSDYLQEAVNKCGSDLELSDYLNLPHDFIKKALQYYADTGTPITFPEE